MDNFEELTDIGEQFFAEWQASEMKYHQELERKLNRFLKAVRKVKGNKFADDLTEVFKEVEATGEIEIVNKPTGEKQKESWGSIKYCWCDQWSVGDSGDSFKGYVYIKLKPKKYLKIYFSI